MNNGDKVVNFCVVVFEKWKDKNIGECKEKIEWVFVIFWGLFVGIVE